ncbi:MAG: sulfite exporter TauE/SafE family protein [Methanopyri archaeon]|jgi:hypothetical protein|nr:sulfite exporter TauE/SafE family protein [Methanopyri archaeon]|tara:strand:+ start:109 stop:468 length:360 start_codon:yes stop_codon:yes gene_type:complete
MLVYASYVLLGLAAGVLSGLLGIGGGILLIPVMVYGFGLSQHEAQGTTLALMVLPIGLLAAYKYYLEDNVNVTMAGFICLGFFFGGYLGADIANDIEPDVLRRVFGVALMATSLRMIFS